MAKEKISLKSVGKGRYSLDARGYSCPYPEIFARRALDAISPGDMFELIIDNKPSCERVPAAAEEMKHRVLSVDEVEKSVWKITIQKQ